MANAHTPDTTPIATLIGALAKANADVQQPKKNKTNPHFRSKYADVADVENVVRPAWKEHGLSWWYDIHTTDTGLLFVGIVIIHESGATLHQPGMLRTSPENEQQLISRTTYLKRLVLSAAAGVSADEDDDGNEIAQEAAQQPRRAPQTQQDTYGQTKPVQRVQARPDDPANEPYLSVPPPRPQALSSRPDVGSEQPASPKAVKYMWTLLRRTGMTDDETRQWVAAVAGMDPDWHTEQLTGSQVSHIIDQLKSEEQQ